MYDLDKSQAVLIAEFKQKLSTDKFWVEKAILVLYERQTEDEKIVKETSEKNGVGFTGADGFILSSFAVQLKDGRHLSPKQLEIAFPKMAKYAKQLLGIAKSKETTKENELQIQ